MRIWIVISLLFLSPAQALAQPDPESDHAATIRTYRALLQGAASSPVSEQDSLFYKPPVISDPEIELATEELKSRLELGLVPSAAARITLLNKISNQEAMSSEERGKIVRELDQLSMIIQNQLEEIDKKRSNYQFMNRLLITMPFTAVGAILPILVNQNSETNHALTIASIAMGVASGLNVLRIGCSPYFLEFDQDTRDWQTQLAEWGPDIDAKLHSFFNPLTEHNSEHAPQIPYYSALLNRVGAQLQHNRPALAGSARSRPENVAIQISHEPEARFQNSNPLRSISDYHKLKSVEFNQAIEEACEEIYRNPYSLLNQLKFRRLMLLSQKRKEIRALSNLLSLPLHWLRYKSSPEWEHFFRNVFLMGVNQGDYELTRLLLEPYLDPTAIPSFLYGPQTTFFKAQELAIRKNHTDILRLFSEFAERTHGNRPRERILRQTASHDRHTEATLQDAAQKLMNRYQIRIQEKFSPINPMKPQIRELIETKIDQLANRQRLTPEQALIAKALLSRIDEPFNERDPQYDANHLYLWNTAAKKQKTKDLLKIALVALEDEQAFEQHQGRPMLDQDREDNWTAWVLNALYDGSSAYSIDRGATPNPVNVRPSNSCIAGVDHRILHGLTGIHPDVQISAGSNEESNLLTWKLAQEHAKEQRKADFYNSAFSHLLQEWATLRSQSGSKTILDESKSDEIQTHIYFNPLASHAIIQDYQKFVSQRAETLLGTEILSSDELKTLLETIQENPDLLLKALQELTPAGSNDTSQTQARSQEAIN